MFHEFGIPVIIFYINELIIAYSMVRRIIAQYRNYLYLQHVHSRTQTRPSMIVHMVEHGPADRIGNTDELGRR